MMGDPAFVLWHGSRGDQGGASSDETRFFDIVNRASTQEGVAINLEVNWSIHQV